MSGIINIGNELSSRTTTVSIEDIGNGLILRTTTIVSIDDIKCTTFEYFKGQTLQYMHQIIKGTTTTCSGRIDIVNLDNVCYYIASIGSSRAQPQPAAAE
jgi:hypothetical protein